MAQFWHILHTEDRESHVWPEIYTGTLNEVIIKVMDTFQAQVHEDDKDFEVEWEICRGEGEVTLYSNTDVALYITEGFVR